MIPTAPNTEMLAHIFKEEYTNDSGGFFQGPPDLSFARAAGRARALLGNKGAQCYVPTVFSAADEFEMVPSTHHNEWKTLADYLDFFSVTGGVLFQAPIFWQLESRCHQVCRSRGLFIYQGSLSNVPVTAEVVSKACLEFVVGSTDGIAAVLDELKNKQKPHRLCGLLHVLSPQEVALGKHRLLLDAGVPCQKEIHLIPGYEICHQTPVYLNENRDTFVLSDEYIWEIDQAGVFITACSMSALPVRRFMLPFGLEEVGNRRMYRIVYGN